MTAPAVLDPTGTASDNMEHVISSTMSLVDPADIPKETVTPLPAERQRGPDGKFLKAGEAVSVEGTPTPSVEGAPPVEAEVVIPEGHVAAPTLDETRARGFKVFVGDTEVSAPDATWHITANGKPRELRTDQMVSYAQMGVYNHEREVATQATSERAAAMEQRVQEAETYIQQREQYIARLLSDPDYLIQSIQQYERENTPEMRAQRDREALERERQQFGLQRMQQQAVQFVEGELEPAIGKIVAALPNVAPEEMAARLYLFTQRYIQNGVLNPKAFDLVRRHVADDLVPWAKQLHEHRQFERGKTQTEAERRLAVANAATEAERVKAQKARSQAARGVQPVGKSVAPSPTDKPIRTAQDAEDRIIHNTMAAMRGG